MEGKLVLLTLVVIFFFGCGQSSNAQKTGTRPVSTSFILKKDQEEKLDSLITSAISDRIIPGGVLSIFVENEEVYKKAFGWAQSQSYEGNPIDHPEAMHTSHLFDLASLTKVFATTMAIMKLVSEKKIKVTDFIGKYLVLCDREEMEEITIQHLLTHTSGLAPWKPLYYHASNSEETYRYICSLPLASSVGAERHYSDLGFMLLGYIVEAVAKMPLEQYVTENIYDQLGLEHTTFLPMDPGYKFAATSHGNPFEKRMVEDPDFGFKCDENPDDFNAWRHRILIGEVNDGNAYYANDGVAGHAGLFSTCDDLQELMQLLLNGGLRNGRKILDEHTIKTFLTQDAFGHGLGWAMSPSALPVSNLPQAAFGHTGFTGTYALGLPDRHASLILLTNRLHMGVDDEGYYPSVTALRRAISEYFIEISDPEN